MYTTRMDQKNTNDMFQYYKDLDESLASLTQKNESTGQIYVRGIFVEHPHDIFPEYSEKVPYQIPGNILK